VIKKASIPPPPQLWWEGRGRGRGRGALSSGSKEPLDKNVKCTYIFIKKALKMKLLLTNTN
jgi:hypothetical protein